jgi:hypothetical protein
MELLLLDLKMALNARIIKNVLHFRKYTNLSTFKVHWNNPPTTPKILFFSEFSTHTTCFGQSYSGCFETLFYMKLRLLCVCEVLHNVTVTVCQNNKQSLFPSTQQYKFLHNTKKTFYLHISPKQNHIFISSKLEHSQVTNTNFKNYLNHFQTHHKKVTYKLQKLFYRYSILLTLQPILL